MCLTQPWDGLGGHKNSARLQPCGTKGKGARNEKSLAPIIYYSGIVTNRFLLTFEKIFLPAQGNVRFVRFVRYIMLPWICTSCPRQGDFLYITGGDGMSEAIVWIQTPKSCTECQYYDSIKKRCSLSRCRYPARRGGNTR